MEYISGVTPVYERIAKYVYRRYTKYRVEYNHNIMGVFDTAEEAVMFKNKMIQEGVIKPSKLQWRSPENYQIRYLTKKGLGKWCIQKKVDGKIQYFGTYHSIEDARDERDYMESINWDYDNME